MRRTTAAVTVGLVCAVAGVLLAGASDGSEVDAVPARQTLTAYISCPCDEEPNSPGYYAWQVIPSGGNGTYSRSWQRSDNYGEYYGVIGGGPGLGKDWYYGYVGYEHYSVRLIARVVSDGDTVYAYREVTPVMP